MSNRTARFLKARVRIRRKAGRGFRLPLPPAALYVPYQAVLSFQSAAALWPACWGGHKARAALEACLVFLCQLMRCEPQEYVRVDIQNADADILVRVRTL